MNKTFISQLQGGKYQVNSLIGSGGFGNTYLATQVTLGRKVAIKEFFMKEFCERDESTSQVIIPTEGSRLIVDRYRQKFLKEAQMIASLRNEHIIKIYDIFEENNTAYYVMDYIEGGSLKDAVDSKGPLSESKAIGYIEQISDALSYLHSSNILHLDIKPSNVLIDNDDCLVLIDFGISKHYDSDGGQTSTTPAGISKGYAPIEQYQQGSIANFSPATDIYSLGATMFFLLTGKTPPEASIVNEDGLPNDIDSFTHKIRSVIIKSMSPRRKDRYQSAEEFKSAIVFKSTETSESKKTLSNSSEDTILLTEKLDIPSPDMATHLNRSEDSRKNISNQISNDWNKKKHGLIIKLVIIFALSMVGLSYYIVSDIKDKEAQPYVPMKAREEQ
jgi:serine/threonine protein kinase